MVKKIVEKSVVNKTDPKLEAVKVKEEITPKSEEKSFDVIHDDELGTVSFTLSDGTKVEMKEPQAKQMLLLESWLSSPKTEEEYKTTSFIVLKTASLCIFKFGDEDKITFDKFVEELKLQDLERVVAAFATFRDFFKYLSEKFSDQSSESTTDAA